MSSYFVSEKEFVVNEYITLKLEEGKTVLYVNGQKFMYCMQLVIQIPKKQIKEYRDVKSIDESLEIYSKMNDHKKNISISPKQEFWGHCSNIQAFVENNYDGRLLHSNLSLPLLRELSKNNNNFFLMRLKEEIASRLENATIENIIFLNNEGFLQYLKQEELFYSVLHKEDAEIMQILSKIQNKEYIFNTKYKINRDKLYFLSSKRRVIEIEININEIDHDICFNRFNNLRDTRVTSLDYLKCLNFLEKAYIRDSSIMNDDLAIEGPANPLLERIGFEFDKIEGFEFDMYLYKKKLDKRV